jgi:hypothetical protein
MLINRGRLPGPLGLELRQFQRQSDEDHLKTIIKARTLHPIDKVRKVKPFGCRTWSRDGLSDHVRRR